jgi:hypothetical protein
MEYLTEAFIAIAIIAVVAVAAVSFEPANPLAPWLRLADRYGTDRRPSQRTFTDVGVLFGSTRGALRPLTDFAKLDVELEHVRFVKQKGDRYLFDLFAEPPVRIAVQGEPGAMIQQKCQGDAT